MQGLQGFTKWRPIVPLNAKVAKPGILEVDQFGAPGNRSVDRGAEDPLRQVDHEPVAILVGARGARKHIGRGERGDPRTRHRGRRNDTLGVLHRRDFPDQLGLPEEGVGVEPAD